MSTVVQSPPTAAPPPSTILRLSTFALVLAGLIALCFPQVLLGLKTFVYRDFGLFGYPLAYHLRESLWQGELPLWNPYSNCGLPFLAQWNTMVLYPFSLLYVVLPLPWSLNLFCLAHLFLGGVGMYILARHWTGSPVGAAIAGTGFAFNGLTLCALMWPNNSAALGWMPWVVWSASRAWQPSAETGRLPGGRPLIVAVALGALQMLSGAPEIILLTWLFVVAFWLANLWRTPARKGATWRLALIVTLITGVCAAQLLPFLELLGQSHRSAPYSGTRWSMPPWGWANLIVPLFRTYESTSGVYFQANQGWTSSYYAGIGSFALAIVATLWVRDTRVRVLAGLTVLALILALGDNGLLWPLAQKRLPFLSAMRYPVKFVVCAIFAIPLLAAFGMGWCEAVKPRLGRLAWPAGFLLLAAMALVCGDYVWPIANARWSDTAWSAATRAFFLCAIVGGVWWSASRPVFRHKAGVALALVVLVWLDGYTHVPSQNPTVNNSVFARGLLEAAPITPQPTLGKSRAMLSLDLMDAFATNRLPNQADNLLLMRVWQYENLNLLERIPKVDGFYSLYLPHERELHFRLYGADGLPRPGLADFLGVSQVAARAGEKGFTWSYRSGHQPMTTLSGNPVFLERAATLTNLMRFDPRQAVFLPRAAQDAITAKAAGRVVTNAISAHRIAVEVETAASTLLVVAQTAYPAWRAYVDARPVPLYRANYAFQAVQVPPGRHRCEIRYEDNYFRTGLVVSIVSLGACLAIGMFARERS